MDEETEMTPYAQLLSTLEKQKNYDPYADPEMNPGIVRTVAWLREKGYATIDSGDGRTGNCECDEPYPYVHIAIIDTSDLAQDAETLKVELDRLGHGPELWTSVWSTGEGDELGNPPETFPAEIQLTYSPVHKVAVLSLLALDDARLFGSSAKN